MSPFVSVSDPGVWALVLPCLRSLHAYGAGLPLCFLYLCAVSCGSGRVLFWSSRGRSFLLRLGWGLALDPDQCALWEESSLVCGVGLAQLVPLWWARFLCYEHQRNKVWQSNSVAGAKTKLSLENYMLRGEWAEARGVPRERASPCELHITPQL